MQRDETDRTDRRACRRVPIDFAAVAAESGMKAGKLGFSPVYGWCVHNVTRNPDWPDAATITPPPMEPGETRMVIADDYWVFYAEEKDLKIGQP
jgi:hypothetical protein